MYIHKLCTDRYRCAYAHTSGSLIQTKMYSHKICTHTYTQSHSDIKADSNVYIHTVTRQTYRDVYTHTGHSTHKHTCNYGCVCVCAHVHMCAQRRHSDPGYPHRIMCAYCLFPVWGSGGFIRCWVSPFIWHFSENRPACKACLGAPAWM